jgi:hypothetical protein
VLHLADEIRYQGNNPTLLPQTSAAHLSPQVPGLDSSIIIQHAGDEQLQIIKPVSKELRTGPLGKPPASFDSKGIGSTVGLGKLLYYIEQMKCEATEADRAMKNMQREVRMLKEKNKDMEQRCRDMEKRCKEERASREAAESKMRQLKKKLKDVKETKEAPLQPAIDLSGDATAADSSFLNDGTEMSHTTKQQQRQQRIVASESLANTQPESSVLSRSEEKGQNSREQLIIVPEKLTESTVTGNRQQDVSPNRSRRVSSVEDISGAEQGTQASNTIVRKAGRPKSLDAHHVSSASLAFDPFNGGGGANAGKAEDPFAPNNLCSNFVVVNNTRATGVTGNGMIGIAQQLPMQQSLLPMQQSVPPMWNQQGSFPGSVAAIQPQLVGQSMHLHSHALSQTPLLHQPAPMPAGQAMPRPVQHTQTELGVSPLQSHLPNQEQPQSLTGQSLQNQQHQSQQHLQHFAAPQQQIFVGQPSLPQQKASYVFAEQSSQSDPQQYIGQFSAQQQGLQPQQQQQQQQQGLQQQQQQGLQQQQQQQGLQQQQQQGLQQQQQQGLQQQQGFPGHPQNEAPPQQPPQQKFAQSQQQPPQQQFVHTQPLPGNTERWS